MPCLRAILAAVASLALLAPAPAAAVTQRLTPEVLQGTWRWVSSSGGPTDSLESPAACGCERFLTLDAKGGYLFVERDSLAEYVLAKGGYAIHPPTGPLARAVGDPEGADVWVSFVGWWIDYEKEQLLWFGGRDTLYSYPGTADAYVSGAMTHRFVRETSEEPEALQRVERSRRSLRDRPGRPGVDRVASVTYAFHGSMAPKPVVQVLPVYSAFAKEARIEGDVTLTVTVEPSGRVGRVDLVRGVTGLDESAIDALDHWVFQPALEDGAPVEATVEVVFRFDGATARILSCETLSR